MGGSPVKRRLLVGECVYAVARGGRCGAKAIEGRSLCAKHVTARCTCDRQAVRECREHVGDRVCARPRCTRCKCPVHSNVGAEPKVIVYAR